MATETFRYIDYSDETLFTKVDSRIQLKEFRDNLLLYTSFDSSLNADYYQTGRVPETTGTITNENWGTFGQYCSISGGSVRYDKGNFDNLALEGSIQFRLNTLFNSGYGYQDFIQSGMPVVPLFPKINTTVSKFGGGSLDLTGGYEKYIEFNGSDNLDGIIQQGAINFFFKLNYSGIPENTVEIFSFNNEGVIGSNYNKIEIYHGTGGKITAIIYSQNGTVISSMTADWTPDTYWHELELNFNVTDGENHLFIDGTRYASSTLTGTRNSFTGKIRLGGTNSDVYIEDLAIYNIVKHTDNYNPRVIATDDVDTGIVLLGKFDTTFALNVAEEPTVMTLYPLSNDFGFKLKINDEYVLDGDEIVVALTANDIELTNITDKLTTALSTVDVTVSVNDDNNIRIQAATAGDMVSVVDEYSSLSFVDLLGGTNEAVILNVPGEDVKLIDFYDAYSNVNRFSLVHTTEGKLHLFMYDNAGGLRVSKDFGLWSNPGYEWVAFDITWNKSIVELFIDGVLVDVAKTSFTRAGGNYLFLNSGDSQTYGFDEVQVFIEQQHTADYTVPTNPLTTYPTTDPYIDIHFGSGFTRDEVRDLTLNCSSDIHFVTKIGESWYYYFNSGWQTSDGSFSQTNGPAEMETKFSELMFLEDQELIIRAYFHSEGTVLAWLDNIEITIEASIAETAQIVGTIALVSTVDLSEDYNVVITTDKDSKEVDISSQATDTSAVTLAEIKAAINAANIDGLASASDDGSGHLVLYTTSSGSDAFVSISPGSTDDALEIIWGYEASDIGAQATGQYFDYTEIYRWIRSMLGAPTVPVELTDEQLQDCVGSAVYWYNYYRNAKESTIYVTLTGNSDEGYDIPQEVGGEDNIIEIIMRPRFPYTYYAGRTDIVGQIYLQWFFMQYKTGLRHFAGDYYLTMSTQQDINNIMGTNVQWHFYNGKLFIHPKPVDNSMRIAIRFRSAVTVNEINTNIFIKNYAIAKAKTILGTIRSTFGSSIPGGSEMITLRGEALISEGKEEMEQVLSQLRSMSEPLGFDWG